MAKKFPSPLGDYFFNTHTVLKAKHVTDVEFPSPSGDYFFNNDEYTRVTKGMVFSFRPH